jgi:hypothetical protein
MPALNFNMQPQQRTNWCWAAVATSVQRYYVPGSNLTQCVLVNQTLGRADCCQVAGWNACNVGGDLGLVLNALGRLRQTVARPATFAELQAEIQALHPICIRVVWLTGGAHFMACTGYYPTNAGLVLLIQDPWWGAALVFSAFFPLLYHQGGYWSHTCFTR